LRSGSAAQFRWEFVFRAAGCTGGAVHRYTLLWSHFRRNRKAAIAAKVIGVTGSAKQRSGGLRYLPITGIRSRMGSLQDDGWHFDPFMIVRTGSSPTTRSSAPVGLLTRVLKVSFLSRGASPSRRTTPGIRSASTPPDRQCRQATHPSPSDTYLCSQRAIARRSRKQSLRGQGCRVLNPISSLQASGLLYVPRTLSQ
jgi:hypothetical protein